MHRRLEVRGLVQGVGFRPWVWQEATRLGLIGWVRNTSFGVEIDLHGEAPQLDALQDLLWHAPAPARVEQVHAVAAGNEQATSTPPFAIRPSTRERAPTALLAPDTATCSHCLSELFDPTNRRWRHPFIQCPHCGPRLTLTRHLPFDRGNTSYGAFEPCAHCLDDTARSEDRRFHDQTSACPQCGPRLSLIDRHGKPVEGDPIEQAWHRIQSGQIVAIKGTGGFHLFCDARQPQVVQRLRDGKPCGPRPMALMAANIASVPSVADSTPQEHRWLASAQRPVVLLKKQAAKDWQHLAPGLAWLGVMLPENPIHHLLFHEAAGRPVNLDWLSEPQALLLAFTSGNRAGEPMITDNDKALSDLHHLADCFLVHDRAITMQADDSVLRVRSDGSPCVLRRGRGLAPVAVPRPETTVDAAHSVLALGGRHHSTLCVAHNRHAQMAPPMGELDHPATRAALRQMAGDFPALIGAVPTALACDADPTFYSSELARSLAQEQGVPLLTVRHHHAHVAAVLAEHGLNRPVIGLVLDGYLPSDADAAPSSPLLQVAFDSCKDIGQFKTLSLGHAPAIHNIGQLFDALASHWQLEPAPMFRGDAALRIEALAMPAWPRPPLLTGWTLSDTGVLDFQPLLDWVGAEPASADIASVTIATLVAGLTEWTLHACRHEALDTVVLTGGCAANLLLSECLQQRLAQAALIVHQPTQYPGGDGGLSLGQAWVARHRLQRSPQPATP